MFIFQRSLEDQGGLVDEVVKDLQEVRMTHDLIKKKTGGHHKFDEKLKLKRDNT